MRRDPSLWRATSTTVVIKKPSAVDVAIRGLALWVGPSLHSLDPGAVGAGARAARCGSDWAQAACHRCAASPEPPPCRACATAGAPPPMDRSDQLV